MSDSTFFHQTRIPVHRDKDRVVTEWGIRIQKSLCFNSMDLSGADDSYIYIQELKHIEIPDSRSGYESVNIFSSLVT